MERIHYLIAQHLSNKASTEEVQEMLQWLKEHPGSEALLEDAWKANPQPAPVADLQRMWAVIEPATAPQHYRWRIPAAAAAATLLLGVSAYLYLNNVNKLKHPVAATTTLPYIAPGRSGAVLTLGNGSHISLDSATTGVVAVQNGAQVVLSQQQLSYQSPGEPAGDATYNTVSTPNGRQFQLQLPDGSRAWLNAASSIRFPTTFAGNERRVSVTGEVYFEIAQNAAKPFFVNTPASEVAVLGTEFDVNAYADEAMEKTTLVSGKVAANSLLNPRRNRIVLNPGEQVQMGEGIAMQVRKMVDVEQVLAWKNGAFNFQDLSLQQVMRQLSRWYDLEIVYEKGIPDVSFGGEMSRNVPLADLLDGLKQMGIHFRVEGRKLIVSP